MTTLLEPVAGLYSRADAEGRDDVTSSETGLTEALTVWVRGFVQRATERQLRELATGGIPATLVVARSEVENQA